MINYDRSKVEIGILHFGLGGFHRAHQAVFADLAIENGNYELGIASISQRDPSLADEMSAANSITGAPTLHPSGKWWCQNPR